MTGYVLQIKQKAAFRAQLLACVLSTLFVPRIQADLPAMTVDAPAVLQNKIVLETVTETVLQDTLRASGRVSVNENHQAKIGPSISGRVIEVRAHLGQMVHRGEVLAVIHSAQLSDAQAHFLKAKSQVELKRLFVERSRKLYEEGIISLLNLRERESALTEKEIEMNAFADQLTLMGMHQDDLQRLSRQKGVNSNTRITATTNGSVIDRRISVGQIVEISDELFVIADLSEVWVVAEVPEKAAMALELNAPANIEIPALAHQRLKGTLSFIADTVDPDSRTIKIRIVVPNPDFRLKPEMLANIYIQQPSLPALTISASAVIRDQNQDYVFVEAETHRYTLRAVTLDDEIDGRRRVISGLSAGEKVVTRGSFQLNSVRLQTKGS
jgi:cobalt-zinc-cadmium efflux system membrane fusion protein